MRLGEDVRVLGIGVLECEDAGMGASINRGPQDSPQNALVLILLFWKALPQIGMRAWHLMDEATKMNACGFRLYLEPRVYEILTIGMSAAKQHENPKP